MNEKIIVYINNLFKDVQLTKRSNDLKEEIITNTNEKYNDLVSEGKSEEIAFENAVAGIGDINELLIELSKNSSAEYSQSLEIQKKKTALIVSVSVFMYIMCIVYIIIASELNLPDFVGVTGFFMIAAIPTCVLIYHFMTRTKYSRNETTVVEEFKEWKSDKKQKDSIRDGIESIVWTIITIIYLAISFSFSNWNISWIIFIIGAVINKIIDLIYQLKEVK